MATPNINPFGAPLALYLEAQGGGLLVKLAGRFTQNPATGQLAVAFEDLPQLPFSDIRLAFVGGQFALLANPSVCGLFTATGDLAPWSAGSDVTTSSSFQIAAGAGGGACPESPSPPPSPNPSPPSSNSNPAPTSDSGPTSTVTLDGTRIETKKSGKASIKLACAGASVCRGKLTLKVRSRSKTMVIGTATFSIPAGKSKIVALNLDATGRKLLGADHGRLDADLAILGLQPSLMQTRIESVRLVLERTAKLRRRLP